MDLKPDLFIIYMPFISNFRRQVQILLFTRSTVFCHRRQTLYTTSNNIFKILTFYILHT